jgi:hypothetical protein
MDKKQDPEAAETVQTTNVPAVDLPRLVRLYDWLRVEQHHGEVIACGGIFPSREIQEGQRWQGSSGHTVTVECVNGHSVHYSWVERGTKMTHDKAHFAFQCRYCLILPNIF